MSGRIHKHKHNQRVLMIVPGIFSGLQGWDFLLVDFFVGTTCGSHAADVILAAALGICGVGLRTGWRKPIWN